MKKFILFLSLGLVGCSNSLPSNVLSLSEFIPREKEEIVLEELRFGEMNFPENCEWFDLKRVVDGDTVKLGDGTSVRFVGVDTPETVHPNKPVQYCGREASEWTKKVFNGDERVCLIFDELSDERDKYNRRLGYPFTEEGIDVTAELLKLGLARGYFYFPFMRKEEFRFYHDTAKDQKLGVWGRDSCQEV